MKNATVYDLFRETATRIPEKTAIVSKDGVVCYGKLLERVNALGRAMLAHNIGKGTRIGTLMRNNEQFILLLYASHLTGAVIVPFNFRNNSCELARQLEYSECEYLFYDGYSSQMVDDIKDRFTGKVCLCSVEGTSVGGSETLSDFLSSTADGDFPSVRPEDWALMLFTGGTTGLSKLAVHNHRGLYNWVVMKTETPRRATEQDVFLMSLPMCHSAGLGMLHDMLSNGSTVVLEERFDAERILSQIPRWGITQIFMIPPTIVKRLAEQQKTVNAKLASVRMVSVAGGAVDAGTIACAFGLFENAKVCTVYSQSERAAYTMEVLDRHDAQAKKLVDGSVGKPYLGCVIELRDAQGRPVAPGEPGIAWARSDAQMVSYLHNEEPYAEGWLNTGDILSCDEDGNYIFLSRVKDCIKTGGENVYASEVERVLALCPGVVECAVFGQSDPVFREIVAAAVIPAGGLEPERLIELCREKMASYKKPRKIFFLSDFPRTSIGKINNKALAEQLKTAKPVYSIHD